MRMPPRPPRAREYLFVLVLLIGIPIIETLDERTPEQKRKDKEEWLKEKREQDLYEIIFTRRRGAKYVLIRSRKEGWIFPRTKEDKVFLKEWRAQGKARESAQEIAQGRAQEESIYQSKSRS